MIRLMFFTVFADFADDHTDNENRQHDENRQCEESGEENIPDTTGMGKMIAQAFGPAFDNSLRRRLITFGNYALTVFFTQHEEIICKGRPGLYFMALRVMYDILLKVGDDFSLGVLGFQTQKSEGFGFYGAKQLRRIQIGHDTVELVFFNCNFFTICTVEPEVAYTAEKKTVGFIFMMNYL